MVKTIEIGGKEVRLDNNIGWTMIYRDQFGRDIVPTLIPMAAAALDIVAGLVGQAGKDGEVTAADLAALVDGETFINTMMHLSGAEFVDFINITWSMAKVCDDQIPEPSRWVRQFDTFFIDDIGPAVIKLILDGILSSKNRERLKSLRGALRPIMESSSTVLSSQESSEA